MLSARRRLVNGDSVLGEPQQQHDVAQIVLFPFLQLQSQWVRRLTNNRRPSSRRRSPAAFASLALTDQAIGNAGACNFPTVLVHTGTGKHSALLLCKVKFYLDIHATYWRCVARQMVTRRARGIASVKRHTSWWHQPPTPRHRRRASLLGASLLGTWQQALLQAALLKQACTSSLQCTWTTSVGQTGMLCNLQTATYL